MRRPPCCSPHHVCTGNDFCSSILQDYLVLLPSAYYEAPILQIRVSEPCTYSPAPDASQK